MKPLRCWVGRHSWVKIPTRDGGAFVQCEHCGQPYREPEGPSQGPHADGYIPRGE
jgi:hypothetical protein